MRELPAKNSPDYSIPMKDSGIHPSICRLASICKTPYGQHQLGTDKLFPTPSGPLPSAQIHPFILFFGCRPAVKNYSSAFSRKLDRFYEQININLKVN
jgi:hypothetical protein